MLNMCLVFWKSYPHYAYKRYAYKKKCVNIKSKNLTHFEFSGLATMYPQNIERMNIIKCHPEKVWVLIWKV